jgi:hypothetical protein
MSKLMNLLLIFLSLNQIHQIFFKSISPKPIVIYPKHNLFYVTKNFGIIRYS